MSARDRPSAAPSAVLDRGRDAFERRAWGEAFAVLSTADRDAPLTPEDLERLATAASLLSRDAESNELWARTHQQFLARGDVPRAARCAFWLAFGLIDRGEQVRAGGWLARAQRLLDEAGCDCVERGYLLMPAGIRQATVGQFDEAFETFARAAALGTRFHDPDLVTLARHAQGRTLVYLGRIPEGVALLDEVMAAVTAGDVSPMIAGNVYCSVLSACHDIFDWRRAREWTAALSEWCAVQPDLVLFRGQCLVRRAEVLQLQGAWTEAMDDARRAQALLPGKSGHLAAGPAWYRLGELHRLHGDVADAEAAYRSASRAGQKPQPGLALLRLAQGDMAAAEAAIRSALDDGRDTRTRCRVLPAFVEIMLAAGDRVAAREAVDEMKLGANDIGAPFLQAGCAQAVGAVHLAEQDAKSALLELRRAAAIWGQLDAPYETARCRTLLGIALRALGDRDGGDLELDAARDVFERLGAGPDLERVSRLLSTEPKSSPGLTTRETQVLRLVATGRTNRTIAGELGISEKTVARHLSNIFSKLGVSTRAAATAWAYEQHLT